MGLNCSLSKTIKMALQEDHTQRFPIETIQVLTKHGGYRPKAIANDNKENTNVV